MTQLKNVNWINVLTALLTPTIAIVGTVIAILQWKINQKRLQHELFNRRIKLFEVVAGYIANAMSRGDVVDGEEYQFLRDTKHARFIFDKEVDDYINEIFRKSIDLQFFSRQIKQLQGKPLEEVSEKRRKVFEWLQNELKNLQKRFEKFLQL
jgi:hypothetical protein